MASPPSPGVAAAHVTPEAPVEARFMEWAHQGSAQVQHPTFGTVGANVFRDADTGTSAFSLHAGDGSLVFCYEFGATRSFRLAEPATDATGNVFITYDAGRHPGVVVLKPVSDGYTVLSYDYDNLSAGLDFYDTVLVGPGKDGRYTLKKSVNDCSPHCATGTVTTTTWRWNGTTYVADQPAPQPKASAPKPKAAATPKATASAKPAPAASVAAKAPEVPQAAASVERATTAAAAPTPGGTPVAKDVASSVPILPVAAGAFVLVGGGGVLLGRAGRR